MKNVYKLMFVCVTLLVFTLIITFINHYKTQSIHKEFVENTIEETIKKVKFDIYKIDNTLNLILKYKIDYFKSIHKEAIKLLKNNKNLDIFELKDILNKKISNKNLQIQLYLINKDYIIYDTTYKKDLNLDMKLLKGAKDQLDTIHKNPENIVVASPSIDIITKKYTTYSYGVLDEEKDIVLEIGFFDGELSSIKEELFNYHTRNQLIDNLEVYAHYGNYIISLTKQEKYKNKTKEEVLKLLTSEINTPENNLIKQVLQSGKSFTNTLQEDKSIYKIIYTPIKDIQLSQNTYKDYVLKLKIDITKYHEDVKVLEFIFFISIFLFLIFFILFLLYLSRSIINPMNNKIQEQYEQLKKQHNFTNILIQNAPISVYYQDKNAEFALCNSIFEELIGFDKNYLVGKNIFDILPKDDALNFTINDSKLFSFESQIEIYESKLINFRTHEIKDVIFYKSAIVNDSNEIDGIIGAILDVTEQREKDKQLEVLNKKLEIKVEEQIKKIQTINQNFESIFNTSKDGMIVLDKDYNFIIANNSFFNILAVDKKIIENTNCKEFAKNSKNYNLQNLIEQFEEKNHILKKEFKFKNGKRETKHTFISMEYMKGLENILVIISDITKEKQKEEEEKQKEKKLLEQSKLAQMGEMISMIAHQWRQPLTSISSILIAIENKIMLKKFEILKDEKSKEFESYVLNKLSDISNFTIHLSNTIDDFRNFYKKDISMENTTSKKIIDDTLRIIGQSIKASGITIHIDKNDDKELKCYKNQLIQVFLNILKNCQDNFEEKKIANKTIWVSSNFIDDKHIIKFRDNGEGIDKKILSRIFEPYFSTKLNKNGTGLGLYMSKMIIEQTHNGVLEVKNIKDGVEFTITLKEEL